MSVRSHEVDAQGRPIKPKASGLDPSLFLIKLGGWMAVAAFGGLFWLVNGGFSVRGLEAITRAFGTGGALFWGFVAAAPLPLPAGMLPQPLVPWVGVVAATLIQIGMILWVAQRKHVPLWVGLVGLLLSLYESSSVSLTSDASLWLGRNSLLQ